MVSAQVLVGCAFIILARRSGTNGLGDFASAYWLTLAVGSLIDFGSSQLMVRVLAKGGGHHAFWHWLFRRTFIQFATLPLVACLTFIVTGGALGWFTIVALAIQPMAYSLAQGVLAAVRALRSPVESSWLIAIGNLVFLLACVPSTRDHLELAALGASGSWVLTALIGFALVRTKVAAVPGSSVRNPWRGAWSFGLFGLATAAPLLVLPLVRSMANANEAGELAAIMRWTQPILALAIAYSALMFPALSRARSNRDALMALTSFIPICAVSFTIVGISLIQAPWFIQTLLGASYGGSVGPLRGLLIATVPATLGIPIATLLQATDHDRFVGYIGIASSIVILGVTAGLVRSLGAMSAPYGLFIGTTLMLGLLCVRARRHLSSLSVGVE